VGGETPKRSLQRRLIPARSPAPPRSPPAPSGTAASPPSLGRSRGVPAPPGEGGGHGGNLGRVYRNVFTLRVLSLGPALKKPWAIHIYIYFIYVYIYTDSHTMHLNLRSMYSFHLHKFHLQSPSTWSASPNPDNGVSTRRSVSAQPVPSAPRAPTRRGERAAAAAEPPARRGCGAGPSRTLGTPPPPVPAPRSRLGENFGTGQNISGAGGGKRKTEA